MDVIELRVHGVGGTPPEHLLGETSETDLVRVGGDGRSGFFARRADRTVEGYAWGPLTSVGLLQPLWIFLLPLTLSNVAGWMLLPKGQARWRSWQIARFLVLLLGILLTATYVLGISSIVVKILFYRGEDAARLIEDPLWRIGAGGIATALIGLLVVVVARKTQAGFESVSGPGADEGAQGSLLEAVGGDEDFGQADFWNRGGASKSLLVWHAFAGLAALGAYVLVALNGAREAGPSIGDLGLRPLFVVLGFLQAFALVALFAVCLAGFRRPFAGMFKGSFGAFGPVVAASTAIGLAGGFFFGATELVARATDAGATIGGVLTGPEVNLSLAFGVSTFVFALALGAVLVKLSFFGARKLKAAMDADCDPPVNSAPPGLEPNGVPGSRKGVAHKRALSQFIPRVDLILTLPAIVFTPIATVTLLDMAQAEWDWVPSGLTMSDLEGWGLDPLADFGSYLALTAVAGFFGFLVRGYFNPDQRRKIGILWDVLTFWPRRFHPLAVRPYAERAVPELQWRVVNHVRDRGRRMLLSAHSQGTVLAYAALVQLLRGFPELKTKISFLTYGSPLSQLHARFFPAYFSAAGFEALRSHLFDRDVVTSKGTYPGSWHNFYRLTDYIGQVVDIGTPEKPWNQVVDDPPGEPLVADTPLDELLEGTPDVFRSPWLEMSLHSYYNHEVLVKEWVREVKMALAAAPPQ